MLRTYLPTHKKASSKKIQQLEYVCIAYLILLVYWEVSTLVRYNVLIHPTYVHLPVYLVTQAEGYST